MASVAVDVEPPELPVLHNEVVFEVDPALHIVELDGSRAHSRSWRSGW